MKKNTLIAALSLVCAVGAFGQGQVNFATRVSGSTVGNVNAPVYGVDLTRPGTQLRGNSSTNVQTNGINGIDYRAAPLLTGTGFTAALFGGLAPITDEASAALQLVSTTTFRTQATLPGYVVPPGVVNVLGVPTGQMGTFQLRAWDNRAGTITTWADAMANPAIAHGSSALFTPGFPLGGGTIFPPNLDGLSSFNLVVPEPGVIALGVLGLGALLLRRRK